MIDFQSWQLCWRHTTAVSAFSLLSFCLALRAFAPLREAPQSPKKVEIAKRNQFLTQVIFRQYDTKKQNL
jgi:hypothetical protein